MTSVLPSSFDGNRPQSHQGIHSSPLSSPQILRPASQASLHFAPTGGNHNAFSPPTWDQPSPHPLTAYASSHPQPFKSYQPAGLSLPPLPNGTFFHGNLPTSAPPMPFYPGPAPLYDARTSQPMIRTISHAHPMHSATDQTVSSRFSTSPHSLTHDPPSTAGGAATGYPTFSFTEHDQRHIDPNNIFSSYPMSRSVSGTTDGTEYGNPRLLTPGYEPPYSQTEAELRKVSDSLGGRLSSGRYNHTLSPHIEVPSPGINGMAPHPQPDMGMYVSAARGWGSDFALSAERGKDMNGFHHETDYERERAQQIMNNRKLLEDVGLGGNSPFVRSREPSTGGTPKPRKASTIKRRGPVEAPVRASPRIASQYRNVSYANLDGGMQDQDSEEDEYNSEADVDEEADEEEFRPVKRGKGGRGGVGRKISYASKPSRSRVELSLYGLLHVYPDIPHLFPLFYYTLNNDLSINSESVPLIGSIPSTVTAVEKAEMLRGFYHRGRRVLSQLDAFTARCDKKSDTADEKWEELDYHTRIAVRDVRRKCVERCENYKYTRRDLLDKALGKGKWPPIEQGMIEWRSGMAQNDPAGDLRHVTLTLPTPPGAAYPQQHQQPSYPPRHIKPMPNRRVSGMPDSARSVSIVMGEPDQYIPTSAPMMGYSYVQAPPMYGEDQVPMTVAMPLSSASAHTASSPLSANPPAGMEGTLVPGAWENKVLKRSRSEEEISDHELVDAPTLWE